MTEELVVCVDDSPSPFGDKSNLVRGRIYTVIGLCPHRDHELEGGLLLAEVERPRIWPYCRCFDPMRFRPIKRPDIGELRKLLTARPKFVDEENVEFTPITR